MFQIKFFQRLLISILLSAISLSVLFQTPLHAENNDAKPLSSAEASSILNQRQNTAIDNAINTVAALPQTLFPGCFIDASTQKALREKANKDVQDGKTPTSPVGSDKLVTCLKDIVNIVFIIAIIWVIISIASSNLGLILRSGEGSGEGPIAGARKQIEKALIGLVLIGGVSLLLNLFASNLLSFNIQPLSQTTFKPVAFDYKLPDPNAPTEQANYYKNRTEGTSRTDIHIPSDDSTSKIDIATVGAWINKYFNEQGVVSPVMGETWVRYSRGTTATVESPAIPLQYLISYGQVTANWGATSTAKNNENYTCAQEKRNMFLIPMSDSEQQQNTQLKQKIRDGTVVNCDYVKRYDSWEAGIDGFTKEYSRLNLSYKNDCAIFETLNKKKDPAICPTVKAQMSKFLDFINRQNPRTT